MRIIDFQPGTTPDQIATRDPNRYIGPTVATAVVVSVLAHFTIRFLERLFGGTR